MELDNVLPVVQLEKVTGRYAVLRLRPDEPIPGERTGAFYSITRTAHETSVIVDEEFVPVGVLAETGFVMLKVKGELDFSLTGIMASLTLPLARAGISIFAISTYDTDYLLIQETTLESAAAALRNAGHVLDL